MNELGSGRALSGATPPKGCFSAVRRSRAARRSSARGARANPAGQILSLVRRVGRPSPRSVFLRGANSFARAPCREAFAEGRVLAWGQILSPSRRVGMPSPWGAFSRGANPFAFVPCREAFAAGRVPARDKSLRSCAVSGCFRGGEPSRAGKSFRPCAVSGGFRRGEPSCAGQILLLVRAIGSPRRGARRHAGVAGSTGGLGGRSGPRVGLPKALPQQPQRLCLVATRQDAGTGVEHLILRVRAASRGAGVEFLG